MKSRGPGDKNSADKHDADLDKLRALKEALSKASSASEADSILSQFTDIAAQFSEGLPLDLTIDAAKAVYEKTLERVDGPEQQVNEQNSGGKKEKPHESVINDMEALSNELKNFLEREDIKASRKRNKDWAKDPKSMDAQAKQQFVEACRKEAAETNGLVQSIEEGSVEEIYKRGDEEAKGLALLHGSEDHPEVVASREATDRNVDNYIDRVSQLQSHMQNQVKIIQDLPDVQQALGGEYVKNTEKNLSIMTDEIKEFEKQIAARRSIKSGSIDGARPNMATRFPYQVQNSGSLLPDATPNNLKGQSRGI